MKDNQKQVPVNIQLFAESSEGGAAQPQNVATNTNQGNTQSNSIDYEKIQGMIDSRNQKTEESVLKSYFQSQGMSSDEMSEAIRTYKTQKAENSKKQAEDNTALQTQLQEANKATIKANIEKEAFVQSIELGVDTKTIPYLYKLANFDNVVDEKGNINAEEVKASLQKVLDDIPELKKKNDDTSNIKIGADGSDNQNSSGSLFNFGFTGVRKH